MQASSGLHGRGSRGGRRARPEVDFGRLARAFIGLEIGVVAGEACHAGNQAVRKQRDVGVVVLDGLVVAPPLDRNAVLRAGEFILQA